MKNAFLEKTTSGGAWKQQMLVTSFKSSRGCGEAYLNMHKKMKILSQLYLSWIMKFM